MHCVRHIYVHVPFCKGKCYYCSFYSVRHDPQIADRYLATLQEELETASRQYRLEPITLYVGGGTPTCLLPSQLQRLLRTLAAHLPLNYLTEWTVEGSPDTLTPEIIAVLRDHGVTRVSIGTQSLDDSVLARIGRRHTTSQTEQTVQALQAARFDNIGLDLIACLPGATPNVWQKTLTMAAALNPDHLSVYTLSVAPGCRLHAQQQQGLWTPADADTENHALETAETLLAGHGYQRYEISNYANAGHTCHHNVAVWKGADYIGFGPAAASRIGRQRWTHRVHVTHSSNQSIPEILSPEMDAAERFMFTLRLLEGVNPEHFAEQHGSGATVQLPRWLDQLEILAKEGLVKQHPRHWTLTPRGLRFADTVAECLLP